MNKCQRWEIVGTFFIIIFGTTLHFWFEWTNYWRPVGLIAAVNESTWEHFKMAFWPGLLFALVEYPFLKNETSNFFVAKFVGLLSMPVITVILFYGYTSLTGTHLLWVDVIIFMVSVIGGQYISLHILTKSRNMKSSIQNISIVGLVIMTLAFSLLSFYPLNNFLFAHPGTGEFGILSDYDHDGEH
jgi:hypothetical protein